MLGLLVSGGGVSNSLPVHRQSDNEVLAVAGLPLGGQDEDLPENLPEPMHGILHKKTKVVCCGTNSINSVAIYQ